MKPTNRQGAECSAKRSPLLVIDAVQKRYPGTLALHIEQGRGVSFQSGSIHALVGENGAGKSTLVSVIGGVVEPDAIDATFAGTQFAPTSAPHARGLGIETVRQDSGLVPTLSIAENLFLGRESEIKRWGLVNPRKRRQLAVRALRALDLQEIHPSMMAGSLNLEQQKFLELARAVYFEPQVLIIDEMTASLSRGGVHKLFSILRREAEKGVLVIYISHYLEEVFDLCDQITIMKDGSVVTTVKPDGVDEDELSTLMVGRSIRAELFHEDMKPASPGKVVLETRKLTQPGSFEDVSLAVREGEIVGVAGLVGCGSAELGMSIFGAGSWASGEMVMDGSARSPERGARDSIAKGIGHVPSDRDTHGLVLRMPIYENIGLPHLPWLAQHGFFRDSKHVDRAKELIAELMISCSGPRDLPLHLSGGNRQRVVLAKWMVRPMRLLVLHNPTRGVDIGAKAEIYKVIRNLTQAGLAILLISDDLQEVIGMSDRILTMRHGEVSAEFQVDDTTSEEQIVSKIL